MKKLLDAVLELIGLVLADIFEPRPVVPERLIMHGGFELGIVETIELEHEEQKMRGGGGDALLHIGVEFGARGIDGVAGMNEPGIGREPAEKIVERLVALHRLGQHRPRVRLVGERGELALVGLLECNAFHVGAIEIVLYLWIVDPVIEVGEIPFRQRADAGCGAGLGRASSGVAFGWCRHDNL